LFVFVFVIIIVVVDGGGVGARKSSPSLPGTAIAKLVDELSMFFSFLDF